MTLAHQFALNFHVEETAIHMLFGNLLIASGDLDEDFESLARRGFSAFLALWRLGSKVLQGERSFDDLTEDEQQALGLFWQVFQFEQFEAQAGAYYDD